jgi:hypothetical protein
VALLPHGVWFESFAVQLSLPSLQLSVQSLLHNVEALAHGSPACWAQAPLASHLSVPLQ